MSWEAVGAVATVASAVVTAASVLFIARQTSATRRSAEASEKTAGISLRALEVAQEESSRGQFLAVEATRARLDAATPRLRVRVDDEALWPPYEPSNFGDAQQLPVGHEYVLPRDAGKMVSFHLGLAITNEGPYSAHLHFSAPLYFGSVVTTSGTRTPASLTSQVLPAGKSTQSLWLEVTHTVAQWVAIYQGRDKTRGPVDTFYLDIVQRDPADAGADVMYRLEIDGTLLRPVEGNAAAWTFIDQPVMPNSGSSDGIAGMGWTLHPATRRYFLSRTRGIDLPDPQLS